MATVTDAATGTTRPASRGQVRRSMAPARSRDHARDAAYRAGKAGEAMPFDGEDDELLDLYNQGANERDTSSSSSSSKGKPSGPAFGKLLGRAGNSSVVDESAGLLLGAFLYALGSAWVSSGPAGVKQWLAAKFTNSVPAAPPVAHPNSDSQLKPAPGAGPNGTTPGSGGQSQVSPPSSEGYFSRVPK